MGFVRPSKKSGDPKKGPVYPPFWQSGRHPNYQTPQYLGFDPGKVTADPSTGEPNMEMPTQRPNPAYNALPSRARSTESQDPQQPRQGGTYTRRGPDYKPGLSSRRQPTVPYIFYKYNSESKQVEGPTRVEGQYMPKGAKIGVWYQGKDGVQYYIVVPKPTP